MYDTVLNLGSTLCSELFQNSIPSSVNSLAPDQLASYEAS